MRKLIGGATVLTVIVGMCAANVEAAHSAASPASRPAHATTAVKRGSDDVSGPLEAARRALREEAVKQVLAGKARPFARNGSTVVKLDAATVAKVAKGAPVTSPYVELSREKTDRIFVILTEFGNTRHPNYPDQDTDPNTPGPAVFDGPLHNSIPRPNRTKDNSTNWLPDYNRQHYEQIYFAGGKNAESLKTYYEKQSSGRYSVSGTVTDWVKVKYNEARYGRSNGYPCGATICANTWALIHDASNAWFQDQRDQGRSYGDVRAELATFDQWDRYDYDGDGNFNEPDGYLDHFQIVHAGGDQADGDPYQGEDAIWSHRSYAFIDKRGQTGPSYNLRGGTQIGGTGLWIGDYTIQPENGGRSVFFHEYGHDLGLPDLYDTAGGVGEPMEWWSLMAQSRLGGQGDQSIGNRAGDLDTWSKLQLGWLDYEVAVAGQNRTLQLGPHEYNNPDPQALVVVLPKKAVKTVYGVPHSGDLQWWSGQGDDRTSTMTRQLTLPSGTASLNFQARWNIEDCGSDPCDYAYVEVDDGSGFHPIAGSITKASEGNGIDGYQPNWTAATFDLSAYAGETVGLRIRYATDPAAQGTNPTKPAGIFVDDLTVVANGNTVFSDGAESGANGWTLDGFSAVGESVTNLYDNYYLASWRSYVSYDQYLQYGPYNFGFLTTDKPNWVEHFPYQQGLVIEYWNTQYSDNNVSVHPGEGLVLTVDAHPQTLYRLDGVPWRARVQLYDAPFSKTRADSFTLHVNGAASYIRGADAVRSFIDTHNYFDPVQTDHGVKVARAGVKLTVLTQNGTTANVQLSTVGAPE